MCEDKLSCKKIISESNIKFGTSGARGLVKYFNDDVCAAFTVSFLSLMKSSYKFKYVAIANDNRPSSYNMAMACIEASLQFGIIPIYYGVIPTPALAYKAMQSEVPSIMITGSHIPFDRNGLKFYSPEGEITKEDEDIILNSNILYDKIKNTSRVVANLDAANEYVNRYSSLFDANFLSGRRVGIYEHSSAGRDLYVKIFSLLGAEVISLGRSDSFVPIDTEAVSNDDLKRAKAWAELYNLDMIFSTDGDGDRPLVFDEKGEFIRGDILGLLCADALGIEALAIPINCNTVIEKCGIFNHVFYTKIGSPYVISELDNLKSSFGRIAGFEANGGFILGSNIIFNDSVITALPTRDAVLPALMLFNKVGGGNISSLVECLPSRFTYSNRIENFPKNKSHEVINLGMVNPQKLISDVCMLKEKVKSVQAMDGIRITLESDNIIHFRPSGNAPELRCYSESDTYEFAISLVNNSLENIIS